MLGKRNISEVDQESNSVLFSDESESEQKPKVENTTSSIWNHFSKNGDYAKCSYCHQTYRWKSKTGKNMGTSNLKKHLESTHPQKVQKNLSQQLFDISFFDCKPITILNEENAKNALVNFIIATNQPFNIVEQKTFQDYSNLLSQNSVKIPKCGKTIKSRIDERFIEEKEKLKNTFSNINSKISFTLDGWTSPNNLSLIAITAHWISDSWEMKNCLLAIRELQSHTGENIAKLFVSVLQEFNINESRLMAITMDNASNNDTFVDSCKEFFPSIINLKTRRVRCFAHTINLCCQEFVKEAKKVKDSNDNIGRIEKLRKIVLFINDSPKISSKFAKLQINPLKPILDCKTRWNSTYDMIIRATELKQYLTKFYNKKKYSSFDKKFWLKEDDWEYFSSLISILKIFNLATKKIEGENYQTLSLILPLFKFLFGEFKIWEESKAIIRKELNQLIKRAESKLYDYFSKTSFCVSFGTILDPRFNLRFIENVDLPTKHDVKNYFLEELSAYDSQCHVSNTNLNNLNNIIIADDCEFRLEQLFKKQKSDFSLSEEANTYFSLNEPNIEPLTWWKVILFTINHTSFNLTFKKQNNSLQFPRISKMAKDHLSIQGSSVSCERVFSKGRHLVSFNRAKLSSESIEECLCLKSWMDL